MTRTPFMSWCEWLADDAGLPAELFEPRDFEDEARAILERIGL